MQQSGNDYVSLSAQYMFCKGKLMQNCTKGSQVVGRPNSPFGFARLTVSNHTGMDTSLKVLCECVIVHSPVQATNEQSLARCGATAGRSSAS